MGPVAVGKGWRVRNILFMENRKAGVVCVSEVYERENERGKSVGGFGLGRRMRGLRDGWNESKTAGGIGTDRI